MLPPVFFFSFLSPRQCITCNVGENVLLSPVYNVRRVCCSVKCVKSDEFFRSEDSYSFFFFEKIYRRELVKYLVVRGSDSLHERKINQSECGMSSEMGENEIERATMDRYC